MHQKGFHLVLILDRDLIEPADLLPDHTALAHESRMVEAGMHGWLNRKKDIFAGCERLEKFFCF